MQLYSFSQTIHSALLQAVCRNNRTLPFAGAISEISDLTRYQTFTEGKFMFFDENFLKSSELHYLEPGLYPSNTKFVEAMNILIQKRHNHIESCRIVKMSRGTQKLRFTVQIKNLVVRFSVRTWDLFLKVMLQVNLVKFWVEKDLMSQNLLWTLLAYTRS